MHTFIIVEQLFTAFLIGFDFVTLCKAILGWRKIRYLEIGDEHIGLQSID